MQALEGVAPDRHLGAAVTLHRIAAVDDPVDLLVRVAPAVPLGKEREVRWTDAQAFREGAVALGVGPVANGAVAPVDRAPRERRGQLFLAERPAYARRDHHQGGDEGTGRSLLRIVTASPFDRSRLLRRCIFALWIICIMPVSRPLPGSGLLGYTPRGHGGPMLQSPAVRRARLAILAMTTLGATPSVIDRGRSRRGNVRLRQDVRLLPQDDLQLLVGVGPRPVARRVLPGRARRGAGDAADKEAVRRGCVWCHAPTALATGDYELKQAMTMEAITCDFCHTVADVDLGKPDQPSSSRRGRSSSAVPVR